MSKPWEHQPGVTSGWAGKSLRRWWPSNSGFMTALWPNRAEQARSGNDGGGQDDGSDILQV